MTESGCSFVVTPQDHSSSPNATQPSINPSNMKQAEQKHTK